MTRLFTRADLTTKQKQKIPHFDDQRLPEATSENSYLEESQLHTIGPVRRALELEDCWMIKTYHLQAGALP